MTSDIPAAIVEMGLAGDRRRAARADTAWVTLRPYERRVVREAAVMGYVLGRHGCSEDEHAAGEVAR